MDDAAVIFPVSPKPVSLRPVILIVPGYISTLVLAAVVVAVGITNDGVIPVILVLALKYVAFTIRCPT